MTSPAQLPTGRHDLPPELELVAADTGASLAYNAEHGWHLIPTPALLHAITPEEAPPPVTRPAVIPAPPEPEPALPDLADLPTWLATLNRHLMHQQGYSQQHIERMTP